MALEQIDLAPKEQTAEAGLLEKIERIGRDIVRPAAPDVDRVARFPGEVVEALGKERLLAAYIPETYGGLGRGLSDLVAATESLAQHCGSTGMIWAMHQMQVACLVRHGLASPFLREYLRQAAERQLLIASVTSEVGVGGDIRTSRAAVEEHGSRLSLKKHATTISYGDYAGSFLTTARRTPDAASGDQVLVLLQRVDTTLEQTGNWDTLGMRGTCSPGFLVSSVFSREQILPAPFADIAAQTMVPFSHILWSACWLGIATDALARARAYLRARARQHVGVTQPGDVRFADAANLLQLMRANLHEVVREYEHMLLDEDGAADAASSVGFAIRINNLKIVSSQLIVQIVSQALAICGMAGYKTDSPYSVGRHLRDAYSAGLMVGNDRLSATNAALHLIYKDKQGR